MPVRIKKPMKNIGKSDYVVVAGRFADVGASNTAPNEGDGFVVKEASAGLYTITFDEQMGDLVAAKAGFLANSPADVDDFGHPTPDLDSYDGNSIVVNVFNATANTLASLPANVQLSVIFIFKRLSSI